MRQIRGTYFNGVDSFGNDATITVRSNSVVLVVGEETIDIPFSNIQIESRIANIPRRITWGDTDSFITNDNEAVDALPTGTSGKTIVWLERRFLVTAASLFLVLSISLGFAIWGIPLLAKHVAFMLPEKTGDQIGTAMLRNLGSLLTPSEIDKNRQLEMRDYLSQFGLVDELHFKKSSRIGPNAFALSSTTVVLTDELIHLTENNEEILAVYLHELGHAQLRHVERSILQGSVLIVLLTAITGDSAGVGEMILTLPILLGQTAYSREFEREADEFAVNKLQDADLSPLYLASALQKLEAFHLNRPDSTDHDDNNEQRNARENKKEEGFKERIENPGSRILFEYLSTHPATLDRIRYIEKRAVEQQ